MPRKPTAIILTILMLLGLFAWFCYNQLVRVPRGIQIQALGSEVAMWSELTSLAPVFSGLSSSGNYWQYRVLRQRIERYECLPSSAADECIIFSTTNSTDPSSTQIVWSRDHLHISVMYH